MISLSFSWLTDNVKDRKKRRMILFPSIFFPVYMTLEENHQPLCIQERSTLTKHKTNKSNLSLSTQVQFPLCLWVNIGQPKTDDPLLFPFSVACCKQELNFMCKQYWNTWRNQFKLKHIGIHDSCAFRLKRSEVILNWPSVSRLKHSTTSSTQERVQLEQGAECPQFTFAMVILN